jgi:hypothetical protein
MRLEVHVIQQVFEKQELQTGALTARPISEISNDVRRILTNNRLKARYAQFMWIAETAPAALPIADNIFLQEKTLTFEVVRIESP